jgi:DNA-directed RNA polymerase specialized sigma24 family protein
VSSRSARSAHTPSPVDVYVTAVHHEIVRLVARRQGANAPQDVAQDVVVTLMGKVHEVMARYENPVVYARVAYAHACVQAERRDRVQRGEGSRLHQRADGTRAPGHQVVSGDATSTADDRPLFATLVDDARAVDDLVCNRVDDRRQLAEVLGNAPESTRAAYFMVRGLGYPVTEVAKVVGVRRETLQRHLGRLEASARPLRSGHR